MSSTQQPIRSFSLLLGFVVCGGSHFDRARCALADQPQPVVVVDLTRGVDARQGFDLPSEVDPPQRQSAVASDLDPALDPASEVAQELLRLQQQLGGSVVTDRVELQGWPGPPAPVTTRPTPPSPPQPPQSLLQPRLQPPPAWSAYPQRPRDADSQASDFAGRDLARTPLPDLEVTELREAAWQLATTAHRLEQLDLYDQADALRSLAQRLRQDARGMQQAERAAARAMLEGRSTSD